MAPAGSKWLCAKKDTGWVASASAGSCAAGACTRYSQRPTPLARPTRPTGLRCAPNRLLDQPEPTQANRVWVSDSTYLPLATGAWAYWCAFQEVASKHVVGWHVMAIMPEELITTALQRAFLAQPPTPGLLVHSDRGGQYCGNAYRKLRHDHEAVRSQSRRGKCYDAAPAENRLKVLGASGPASKRRCSNYASGPFSLTY